jgi:ATP-dependent DNA helicase RecQ
MDARDALRQTFGFEHFRSGQKEAVAAALADRDALVVMPTGSGKSLCYQLPGLMRDDLTVVVSPLVSLMQDQVDTLDRIAPGRVAVVNAQRGHAANGEVMRRALRSELSLLYVAPERFAARGFGDALARVRVGLFVVDEAHCVSQWGHDFRPDYFSLADAAAGIGAGATLALTATATPQVADDIARRLRLRDPVRIATGFDRPNLSFAVVPSADEADKHRRIAAALLEPGALPAIVYAGTRKASERLARLLSSALGQEVPAYHAGLDRERRAAAQERFMSGEVPVIVATNAFGMGIDKADVRTVCHASVPQSLEAYYQEAGRAGRDGAAARCLLFAEQRDKGLHVFFIQRARVEDTSLDLVAERLRWAGADGRYDMPLSQLAGAVGPKADEENLRAIVGHFARAGMIAPEPAPPDRAAGRMLATWDGRALARSRASVREAERIRWGQYRTVWDYVERSQCRRQALLRHFGDASAPTPSVPCCDVCAPSMLPPVPAAPAGRGAPAHRGATRGRSGPPSRSGARRRAVATPADLPVALDQAILAVVHAARPPVGRTRAVEILRGGRSKVIAEHAYDALAPYGAFAHLRSEHVLGRVDELLDAGTLRSTGGRFPKLRAA